MTVSFLLFLRGLIGALVVFAIVTYLMTHSLWTTFIHTVICGILIQIGYFAAILFLVRRAKPQEGAMADRDEGRAASNAPLTPEKVPVGRRAGVPEVPRSGHS